MKAREFLIQSLGSKTDINNLSPHEVAELMELYSDYSQRRTEILKASEEKTVNENERREELIKYHYWVDNLTNDEIDMWTTIESLADRYLETHTE